jgi:hypothetical protein
MIMDPMKMVTVVSPHGVVVKFAPNVTQGPFAGFTATFELPPTIFNKGTDYEQVMKDALGFALRKYIEEEKKR